MDEGALYSNKNILKGIVQGTGYALAGTHWPDNEAVKSTDIDRTMHRSDQGGRMMSNELPFILADAYEYVYFTGGVGTRAAARGARDILRNSRVLGAGRDLRERNCDNDVTHLVHTFRVISSLDREKQDAYNVAELAAPGTGAGLGAAAAVTAPTRTHNEQRVMELLERMYKKICETEGLRTIITDNPLTDHYGASLGVVGTAGVI